jgi:hypothetical protein
MTADGESDVGIGQDVVVGIERLCLVAKPIRVMKLAAGPHHASLLPDVWLVTAG